VKDLCFSSSSRACEVISQSAQFCSVSVKADCHIVLPLLLDCCFSLRGKTVRNDESCVCCSSSRACEAISQSAQFCSVSVKADCHTVLPLLLDCCLSLRGKTVRNDRQITGSGRLRSGGSSQDPHPPAKLIHGSKTARAR